MGHDKDKEKEEKSRSEEEDTDSEESTEESEEESSGDEDSGDSELEEVNPDELGEEGTRGLSDILSAVGVNVGGQNKVLRDAQGNPVQPVYTEDGQLATPTLTDEEGNVL